MQFQNVSIKNEKASEMTSIKAERKEENLPLLSTLSFIGEENNKNIRTRVDGDKEIGLKLKEEKRRFQEFKDRAEKAFSAYEKVKEGLTDRLIKGLDAEGLQVEKKEVDVIEKNVDYILKNREKKRENLEKQVENLSKLREEIEKMSLSLPKGEAEGAIRRLQNSGLPLTKANVMKFMAGAELADKVVTGLDEKTMYHTILHGEAESIENLYKWESVPKTVQLPPMEEGLWQEMKAKAMALLEEQGVPEGEETGEAAKWLFQNNLDLSPENVAHYLSFKRLKSEGKTEEGREEILEKIAHHMAEGGEALGTEIGEEKLIWARFQLHYFKTTIEKKAVFHEVSARRQIEEIRLKLTEEVALRMLGKGIKIEVNNLKGIVEQLRKEEEGEIRRFLDKNSQMDGDVSLEQSGESASMIFKETLSIRSHHFKAELGSGYRYEALSLVYHRTESVSLRAYHQAGLAYERGATEIRSDLGDHVRNAFSDIDKLLEKNAFSVTDANRRAAKLLIYNKAEVNSDNLLQMKRASLLVDEVFEEMKPAAVARLVKEGENPLDMSMEDLLLRLKEMKGEEVSEDESRAAFLYKLEQNGELKAEERKAYIGIYRLITSIEKGDMAAVGATLLSGKDLSLRNFLEMERTRKLGSFDESISEDMGELTTLFSENRIDRQIEESYAKLLAGKIKREAEASTEEYLKEREVLLKETNIELTDVEKLMEAGEKITHSTLVAQSEVRGGRKSLKSLLLSLEKEEREEIRNLTETSLKHFGKEEKAAETTRVIQETLLKKSEELRREATSYEELRSLIGVGNLLSLSLKRRESETYDIPLLYGEDKYADLQLTIRKAKREEDSGSLNIKLSLEETEIQLSFSLRGDRLSGFITAERREDIEILRRKKDELSIIVEELGLTEGNFSYHLTKAPSLFKDSDDIYSGRADTGKLYQLAQKLSAYLLKEMGIRYKNGEET